MIKRILGPSPMSYTIRKLKTSLRFRGGSNHIAEDQCSYLSDEAFFEAMNTDLDKKPKPRRLTEFEVRDLLSNRAKRRLTRDQKLLKSVLEEASATNAISSQSFENLQQMYEFRRKYKHYLRIKRIIPLGMISPFTGSELSKMAYAAAIGSKSVSLTFGGFIGLSLPAFFFFHMASYYSPDKFKSACQFCKYTLGAPFWIASYIADEVLAHPEEHFFGEEVPLDVDATGGTIPADLGNFDELRQTLEEMKNFGKSLGEKTYIPDSD